MRHNNLKILLIGFFGLVVFMGLLFIGKLSFNYVTGNVHTVIPNTIYRSAQMNEKNLEEYTNKFHLKTIINLRGVWAANPWYEVEDQFAKTHHLHYYSIQFSAYSLPTKDKILELVNVLQTAPKPLVFHCEGGADRTGMASVISVILFEKNPTITQIEHQVSWHYNAISSKTVGYQMLRNYFAWLKQNKYKSSKTRFLQWANSSTPMKPYRGWFI